MQDIVLFLSNIPASKIKKAKYVAKIDSIMYAMIETWIDIAFATSIVSRFAKNLSSKYFNSIDQILRYLAGSPDKGITFEEDEELKLIEYSDFD